MHIGKGHFLHFGVINERKKFHRNKTPCGHGDGKGLPYPRRNK